MTNEILFLDECAGKTEAEVKAFLAEEFEIEPASLADAKLLFARVSQGGYEGDAMVILERDGRLVEVNGSHCSCHGFEGQWDEEPIADISVLLARDDYEFEGEDKNNVRLTREFIAAIAKAEGK